jgi:hypothetical protein
MRRIQTWHERSWLPRGRILNFVERYEPPYIAKVYRPAPGDVAKDPSTPGRIELWHPKVSAITRRI